jgi:hypothetical protein
MDPTEASDRLHRAGWSIGETGTRRSSFVRGSNGENLIHTTGRIQAEAWTCAAERAAAVGLLAAWFIAMAVRQLVPAVPFSGSAVLLVVLGGAAGVLIFLGR